MKAKGQGAWLREWGPEVASGALAVLAAARIGGKSFGLGFPVDDAWIHMVYGLSLRQGQGLSYNTNIPATGCTSPLWAAVAAVAHLVSGAHGPSMPAAVTLKAIGVLSFAMASSFAARLARFSAPRRRLAPHAALAAGAMVAATPILTYASVSGMEVALTSALLLAAVYAAARGWAAIAGLVAGASVLARPEAVLAVPFVCALLALPSRRTEPRRKVPKAIVAAIMAALPILAIVGRTLHASGRPLPATFYRKGHFAPQTLLGDLRLAFVDLLGALRPTSFFLVWILVAFSIGSGALALWRARQRPSLMVRRLVVPAASACLGLVYAAGMAAATPLLSPGLFYFQRYLLPPVPLFLVAAVCGAMQVIGRPARLGATPTTWAWRAGQGIAVATLIACVAFEIAGWSFERARYARDVEDIDSVQLALGKLIARVVPEQGVVWSQDAGAIRYWGRRRTVDLNRLNTPELFEAGVVDRAWWPDSVAFAWGIMQVLGPPGLLDQIAELHSPSDPTNPLGIQLLLRCSAPLHNDADRRLLVTRKSGARLALGECARHEP